MINREDRIIIMMNRGICGRSAVIFLALVGKEDEEHVLAFRKPIASQIDHSRILPAVPLN
jgi:hypothetical protein